MSGMDDQELMQAAMSDQAPAPQPEPEQAQAEPEQSQDGQPRDEHGRFAPKAAAPEEQPAPQPAQPQQEQQPKPNDDAQVPSWRLREIREAREAAERRAEEERQARVQLEAQFRQLQAQVQQKPPQPPPDMLSDPDGFVQHQQQTVQSAVDRVRFELSEDQARDKYGDEKVDAALGWLKQNIDPNVQARVSNARNPYRELVKLYDERQTLSQIGGDLNAYRSKVLDEALNDPAFMQKVADKLRGTVQPTNGSAPVVQIPPSLNRTTGTQLSRDGYSGSDMSDASLYAQAIR